MRSRERAELKGDALMSISACKTRHRTVSAGGLNLFVREAGEPTQPAVLLLHGAPTSSHTFRNLMPLLADAAHLVAPDMPGFGFSDAPPLDRYEYSFENIASGAATTSITS
jgi:pimeloyl-ACP methyl ester carboxylesterase